MATVPSNTKCSMLGCNNPRSKMNTCCYDHGGVDYNKHPERREHNLMYKSPQWRRKRKTQLSMQPLCQCCLVEKRVKAATVVDHVFPWSALGEEYFYNNLFQSLCTECHNRKTNMEQRGKIVYYSTYAITYTIHDADRVISEC